MCFFKNMPPCMYNLQVIEENIYRAFITSVHIKITILCNRNIVDRMPFYLIGFTNPMEVLPLEPLGQKLHWLYYMI